MSGMAMLARRTLTGRALGVFAASASAPLVVLSAAIPAMSVGGYLGVPIAYVALGLILMTLASSYVSLAARMEHPAPFFAQISQGLGGMAGIAAAAVALFGYAAIQYSLYPLLGTTLAGLFGGQWWAWAAGGGIVVAILGRVRGVEHSRVLAALLALQLLVVLAFIVVAFVQAPSIEFTSLTPRQLVLPGAGGVLVFVMASFVGAETPAAWGEEARGGVLVRRATLGAIGFLALVYAIAAWAWVSYTGTGAQTAEVSQTALLDPLAAGPFAVIDGGRGLGMLAQFLLVVSVITALSVFHAAGTRYVFGLAREGALPRSWARVSTGTGGGTPLAGSTVQMVGASLVLAAFAGSGADPMLTMFPWLSTIGAVAILLLLEASCVTGFVMAHRGHPAASDISSRVVPVIGALAGGVLILVMATNLNALLGFPPEAAARWAVLTLILAVVLLGVLWALGLRRGQPDVFAGLGRGLVNPLASLDHQLADLDILPTVNPALISIGQKMDSGSPAERAGAVRHEALQYALAVNGRHGLIGFENPDVGPVAVTFLFSSSVQPPTLVGASKLWLTADAVSIPVALDGLGNSVEHNSVVDGWDLLDLTNVGTRIDRWSWLYVGLAVSSLAGSPQAWFEARARARAGTEVAGVVYVTLLDGTVIRALRHPVSATQSPVVESSVSLSPLVFPDNTFLDPQAAMQDPQLAAVFQPMMRLHRLCSRFDDRFAAGGRIFPADADSVDPSAETRHWSGAGS